MASIARANKGLTISKLGTNITYSAEAKWELGW